MISHSFLLLTRVGDGRRNHRDFCLLVDISEIATRLCQTSEKEAPCCLGLTFDSPWSSWLLAQKHYFWLKAHLGRSATNSFIGMAELQMISRAFISSVFALLNRPRSISSSSFSTPCFICWNERSNWKHLQPSCGQLSLPTRCPSLSSQEMNIVWHRWPLAKPCQRDFPWRINKFSCHTVTASAVRVKVERAILSLEVLGQLARGCPWCLMITKGKERSQRSQYHLYFENFVHRWSPLWGSSVSFLVSQCHSQNCPFCKFMHHAWSMCSEPF